MCFGLPPSPSHLKGVFTKYFSCFEMLNVIYFSCFVFACMCFGLPPSPTHLKVFTNNFLICYFFKIYFLDTLLCQPHVWHMLAAEVETLHFSQDRHIIVTAKPLQTSTASTPGIPQWLSFWNLQATFLKLAVVAEHFIQIPLLCAHEGKGNALLPHAVSFCWLSYGTFLALGTPQFHSNAPVCLFQSCMDILQWRCGIGDKCSSSSSCWYDEDHAISSRDCASIKPPLEAW